MLVKVETLNGTAVLRGSNARHARATARAWLRHFGAGMGGGQQAVVSVAVMGGCWHRVGVVGNPGR